MNRELVLKDPNNVQFIGKVNNDDTDCALFKASLVVQLDTLQNGGSIANITAEAVIMAERQTKDSVLVELGLAN